MCISSIPRIKPASVLHQQYCQFWFKQTNMSSNKQTNKQTNISSYTAMAWLQKHFSPVWFVCKILRCLWGWWREVLHNRDEGVIVSISGASITHTQSYWLLWTSINICDMFLPGSLFCFFPDIPSIYRTKWHSDSRFMGSLKIYYLSTEFSHEFMVFPAGFTSQLKVH